MYDRIRENKKSSVFIYIGNYPHWHRKSVRPIWYIQTCIPFDSFVFLFTNANSRKIFRIEWPWALLSQRTGSISNVAENLGGNSFSWISFTIQRNGSAATTRTFTTSGLCNFLRESHRDLFSDNPESTYQTSDVCLGLWPRFDDEVSRTIYIFPTDPLPRYRIYCFVFFPISTDIYH